MDHTGSPTHDERMLRGVATALVMTGAVATMRVMYWLLTNQALAQEVE